MDPGEIPSVLNQQIVIIPKRKRITIGPFSSTTFFGSCSLSAPSSTALFGAGSLYHSPTSRSWSSFSDGGSFGGSSARPPATDGLAPDGASAASRASPQPSPIPRQSAPRTS